MISAVFLVMIMGLTWTSGVLIVTVEKLVSLAYIYTILVAVQGVCIFLLFVAFSKKVRDAYAKWWREKVNESGFLSKYFASSSIENVISYYILFLIVGFSKSLVSTTYMR